MSASDSQNASAGGVGFREISQRYLEPISQWIMIGGIVAICQPWLATLHSYGVTITLVGLVGFLVFSKIKPKTDG